VAVAAAAGVAAAALVPIGCSGRSYLEAEEAEASVDLVAEMTLAGAAAVEAATSVDLAEAATSAGAGRAIVGSVE